MYACAKTTSTQAFGRGHVIFLEYVICAKLNIHISVLVFLRSTGFILEGFPRDTEEARYMAESGLYPDCAVLLALEDNDVIDRLLPPKLERWRKKRDKLLEEREKKRQIKEKQKVLTCATIFV